VVVALVLFTKATLLLLTRVVLVVAADQLCIMAALEKIHQADYTETAAVAASH
jgi:hypothetical protein